MTVMQKASVAVLALCAAVVLGAPFDFAQGRRAKARVPTRAKFPPEIQAGQP